MKTLYMELNGVSEVLMHNPQSMFQQAIADRGVSKKTIPTPEEEAKLGLYAMEDGRLYLPAVCVRNCMIKGAVGYRIGKRSAGSILAGAIMITDDKFFFYRNGKNIKDYAIDVRRVVVGSGMRKAGIIRARPMVKLPWQLRCVFAVNESLVSIEHIQPIMENAGQIIGIGDYRPSKTGWFGKFDVGVIQFR